MEFIALFLPAVITVCVRYKRNAGQIWNWFVYVKEYAVALLVNVIVTQGVIVYVLGATGEGTSDFERFAFTTKYLVIACFLAFVFPYIWEALTKAVSVSVDIDKDRG